MSRRSGERLSGPGDVRGSFRFVRSGWVMRARPLRDGRRQVIELLLPGDHFVAKAPSDRDAASALGPCEVVSVPPAAVEDARSRSAEVHALLTAMEARRGAIADERIVSLGQRTALERTAHLFCEVLHRLNPGDGAQPCDWRLTQGDLADVLGLSVVHTNRTIQTLRKMSLAQLGRTWLHVPDPEALADLANFSPDYLD